MQIQLISHKSTEEKAIPQIIDMEGMQSVSAQLGSSFVPSIFYFALQNVKKSELGTITCVVRNNNTFALYCPRDNSLWNSKY